MREILFRGIDEGTKEWVYGYYCESQKPSDFGGERRYYIFDDKTISKYNVLPETVGQYTGLTDKNGKKIFEGDIFRFEDEMVAIIIFKDGCFQLQVYGLCGTFTESGYDECGGGWGIIECVPIDWYDIHDMEIIGNIHDNPELLKGGAD